jgi:hypothetical protein
MWCASTRPPTSTRARTAARRCPHPAREASAAAWGNMQQPGRYAVRPPVGATLFAHLWALCGTAPCRCFALSCLGNRRLDAWARPEAMTAPPSSAPQARAPARTHASLHGPDASLERKHPWVGWDQGSSAPQALAQPPGQNNRRRASQQLARELGRSQTGPGVLKPDTPRQRRCGSATTCWAALSSAATQASSTPRIGVALRLWVGTRPHHARSAAVSGGAARARRLTSARRHCACTVFCAGYEPSRKTRSILAAPEGQNAKTVHWTAGRGTRRSVAHRRRLNQLTSLFRPFQPSPASQAPAHRPKRDGGARRSPTPQAHSPAESHPASASPAAVPPRKRIAAAAVSRRCRNARRAQHGAVDHAVGSARAAAASAGGLAPAGGAPAAARGGRR